MKKINKKTFRIESKTQIDSTSEKLEVLEKIDYLDITKDDLGCYCEIKQDGNLYTGYLENFVEIQDHKTDYSLIIKTKLNIMLVINNPQSIRILKEKITRIEAINCDTVE